MLFLARNPDVVDMEAGGTAEADLTELLGFPDGSVCVSHLSPSPLVHTSIVINVHPVLYVVLAAVRIRSLEVRSPLLSALLPVFSWTLRRTTGRS